MKPFTSIKSLLKVKKGKWSIPILICSSILLLVLYHKLPRFHHSTRVKRAAASEEKKYMKFDEFMDGKFWANSYYPYWISGNEYVDKLSDHSIVRINIESENKTEILPSSVWTGLSGPFWYLLSADGLIMSIFHNRTKGYTHYVRTFSVSFFEVPSGTQIMFPLFPVDGIQQFKWSPVNHTFVFVRGFNVYVVKDEFSPPKQLTSTGDEQSIFNGLADWLFWIEIADDDALLWWSPDGKFLAYATVNDSDVTPFEFPIYSTNSSYPHMQRLPYPKAGTNIPFTTVTIINVESWESSKVHPHSIVTGLWKEYYLNSAVWIGNKVFSPTWKNRLENESMSESCVAPDFTCSHVDSMMEESKTGWVGHYKVSHIFPSLNSEEYFTTKSNHGFFHLARINVTENKVDWRTNGSFEVTDTRYGYTSVYTYDSTWDFVYYLSTERESLPGTDLPRIRHLWKVKARGSNFTRTCVSCQLNVQFPDRCNWVNPIFSKNGSFLVINCGGTGNGIPLTTVHKRDEQGNYQFVRILKNNTQLEKTLQEHYFREVVYGTIQLPGVIGDWYYSLYIPPNLDKNKKYPMLVEVYSGPASQEVQDRFSVRWKDFVSSSLDVVVMNFDGRGSGFRGEEIRHLVYKHLGEFESMDQISAAQIVAQKYSFIDPTRIAIWGWSYGGYATTKVIEADSDNVYKCGYAVAPVTDWQFYHAIYTERYMHKPKDNEENYRKSSALYNLKNFKTHQYTLIHGTRDDNVHFQNSARLTKQLIANDVDFGAVFAADNDHTMGKVQNGYKRICKMIMRQMKSCFNLP